MKLENYILTLDFIKGHCEGIAGYWNGKDEKFVDADGEERHQDDAEYAREILEHVTRIESLLKIL